MTTTYDRVLEIIELNSDDSTRNSDADGDNDGKKILKTGYICILS